jgi:hypothetical protein
MKLAACLLVAFACSGAVASEPGQPLDCSDWVFLEPGLTCTTKIAYPCRFPVPSALGPACSLFGAGLTALDNSGTLYRTERRLSRQADGSLIPCGNHVLRQIDLIRVSAAGESTIAYLRDHCVDLGSSQTMDYACPSSIYAAGGPEVCDGVGHLTFDGTAGSMLIPLTNACLGVGTACAQYGSPDPFGATILAIGGFPTLFDVFQTFTPDVAALGFRVPYMPEGMAGADHFDTYYGPLTRPIDFTQALPLACDYPAEAPAVGDYLEVADPLPAPSLGTGRYYITAATHQGQTRYGRKTTNGQLSGRDPALLPACTP